MTMTMHAAVAAALGAVLLVGCTPSGTPIVDAPPRKDERDVAATGDPAQIVTAGHGELFDSDMRRVIVDEKSLIFMQDGLMKRVDTAAVDPRLRKLASESNITVAERFWLRGAMINAALERRDDRASRQMMQVNDLLLQRSGRFREFILSPALLAKLREFFGRLVELANATDYIRRCRAAGVPIPPDFATTGTHWEYQGNLATNLLGRSAFAGVYTYHDPDVRGACVALPRGSGDAGSASGIICQSATTGAACFWDNKLRSGGPTAPFMGWRNLTLRIADLQDGDNLRNDCTECHSGNNVFVVLPDDPTWGRLLRRSMAGVDHGNFTLRVRNSSDATSPSGSGSSFRYVPISSQGWVNRSNAPGCAESCHEGVTLDVRDLWANHPPASPLMPPACSQRPGTPNDVERCYVNPF